MTLHEIAQDIWRDHGLQFPDERQVQMRYKISMDKSQRVLSLLGEMALTESVAQFGGANMEQTQEWRR